MDRKCAKCSEVVLGNRVICVDCGRKDRAGNTDRRCAFPLCLKTYRSKGTQRYCVEHKGMSSRERQERIQAMRERGLLGTD